MDRFTSNPDQNDHQPILHIGYRQIGLYFSSGLPKKRNPRNPRNPVTVTKSNV